MNSSSLQKLLAIAISMLTFNQCMAQAAGDGIAYQEMNLHKISTASTDEFAPVSDEANLAWQILNSQSELSSTATEWLQVSQVKIPNGITIYKFRNHFKSIPIMGDWAMVTFGASGDLKQVELSAVKIQQDRLNTEHLWPKQSNTHAIKITANLSHASAVKKIWYKHKNQLIPALFVYHTVLADQLPNQMASVFSATDGQQLTQSSITETADFSYKVYALANGYPADSVYGSTQPHPTGAPDDIQPTIFTDQVLLTLESTATNGDPWLADGATETIGNHVDIFFNSLLLPDGTYDDLFSENGAWGPEFQAEDGDFRAQLTSPNTFDYTYDPSISADDFYQLFNDPMPSNPSPSDPQINAKLVQGFFMANTMHDFFYDAGFNELAGNAQHDNYGRGGLENDRMIIHGNCVSTFVFTPEDGVQPVMCLGRNSSSSTNKDASFDYSIFAHEWTHYMYKRLVQGPAIPTGNQGRSLNEGWADLIGLFMSVDEADVGSENSPAFNRPYAVGAYYNTDYFRMPVYDPMGTTPDAHFYGIRRWPFGDSNPFTFKHIEHKQELPLNYNYFDWKGRSKFNSEVHTAGEVWAAAVWDCFRGIFASRNDRTYDQNRTTMAQYMVGGMAATRPDPTFLEARNGLLSAMQAMDELDWQICRQSFADRGMGSGAIAPERFSKIHQGVVESFDNDDLQLTIINSQLSDELVSFDDDDILDHQETGYLSLTLKNTGFEVIEIGSVELISDVDFQFDPTPFFINNLAPGGEVETQIPFKLLHDRQYGEINITVVIALSSDNGNSNGGGDTTLSFRTHHNIGESDALVETLDFPQAMDLWTQESISNSIYTEPKFDRLQWPGSSNQSLMIGEEYDLINQALVSPWLELDPMNSGFNLSFEHSHLLSDIGQVVQVQYSFDEINWMSMITSLNNTADFYGDTTNYPALVSESLSIPDFEGNTTFKVRFRIEAFFTFTPNPAEWIIDNFSFSGISNQPFLAVGEQSSNDLIFAAGFD